MARTETPALPRLWKTKKRPRFSLRRRCATLIDVKSVIAIANQKGGVGKTTSAAALGVILAREGWPVHLIDMDPQADLTTSFGFRDEKGLLYESLTEQEALPIVRLSDTLTLTPSSIDMSRGESSFLAAHGREFLLQGALNKTELPAEATVIIDCPPSLGVLTVNCLAAAQKLIVTVHPGGLEMKALFFLQQTVDEIRERINRELEILGVILTNCDMRKRVTEEARREIGRRYDVLGLVRQDSRLSYATGSGRMLSEMNTHGFWEYEKVAELLTKKIWTSETTPA
jgi:chromosome partitioning protein